MENRQKQQIMFSLHKTTIDHVNIVPTKFDLPQVEKESNISTREKKKNLYWNCISFLLDISLVCLKYK